jgi:transposase
MPTTRCVPAADRPRRSRTSGPAIYHLLSNPETTFCDLGPGYHESRINKHRRAHDLATQLQALTGQQIVIRDGKAVITDAAA